MGLTIVQVTIDIVKDFKYNMQMQKIEGTKEIGKKTWKKQKKNSRNVIFRMVQKDTKTNSSWKIYLVDDVSLVFNLFNFFQKILC